MKHFLMMCVLIFSASTFAFGECSETDRKALEAFDRAWSEAGAKGDRAALMSIYADDYAGMPAMLNKTQTIENTMKAFEEDKANPQMADKITHDNYMFTCTPMTAVITHRNVVTTMNGAGGKQETFWTRSVHFLEKRSGKWQVVGNAGNGLDEYDMLGYIEQDWNNAYKTRNAAWFERNYADDMSKVDSSDGKMMGKKQAIAAMLADKTTDESVQIESMNIRVEGNTAVVTSVVHVKGRDEKGQAFDRRTRYTDMFVKRDGRWMVWASQGTSIPAVAK
jgi:uncharacterized protein (TIGR02246 family)